MSKINSAQIYSILRDGLVAAEQQKNHLLVTATAAEHGLKHGPNGRPAGMGIEDEWRLTDATGNTVLLTWSMHDTTRTFETSGPDSNRLHLSLTNASGQVLDQHDIAYYD